MKNKNIIKKVIAGFMATACVISSIGAINFKTTYINAKENEQTEKEPVITDIKFLENNTMVNKYVDFLHIEFTVENMEEVEVPWIDITDGDNEITCYTDTVIPSENKENTYIAQYTISDNFNGRCEITAVCFSDYTYNGEFTFDIESDECEYFKINKIAFPDNYDGVINMADEISENHIEFDIDYEITGDIEERVEIYVRFFPKDEHTYHIIDGWLYYYPETKDFDNTMDIEYEEYPMQGEYVLDCVMIDQRYVYDVSTQEELSVKVKIVSDDIRGPQINDVYFTVDGEISDEYPVKVEDGQELMVWVDASDYTAGIKEISVLLKGYHIHDDKSSEIGCNMEYDENSGLYYYKVRYEEYDVNEWFLEKIEAVDRYNNYTYATELNDVPFEFIYAVADGKGEQKQYDYTVHVDNNFEMKKEKVTTYRVTSLREMGLDNLSAPQINGAKFLGWETDNGWFIKDSDEKFVVDGNNIIIRPVYDKRIIKIYVKYTAENDKITFEQLIYAVDEGMTYKGLKNKIIKSKELDKFKHTGSLIHDGWDFEMEDSKIMPNGEMRVMFIARYKNPVEDVKPTATVSPLGSVQPIATPFPAISKDVNVDDNVKITAPKLKKCKVSKSKFVIKWSKINNASGYEIVYSTDKKMKKNKKTKLIVGNKKQKITVSRLKSKKLYYVKIRAYKEVNGKKKYSSWSNVKFVKA